MLSAFARLSSFTAMLIGALLGAGLAAVMYFTLPPVRALYHWQWDFMTTHPITFVVCGAIGLAVGYFSDLD